MSKAIFLDRDGTINKEVNYLRKPEDILIFPNTNKALQIFKSLGFLNIIITNQSGIARGFLTEEELDIIHREMLKQLRENDEALIDDIYFSPFHIEGIVENYRLQSEDRKPATGMILKAKSKYNIDLKESFFIGDSLTDMRCAQNAGLKKILVMSGYGKQDHEKCMNEHIELNYFAKDLYDASQYINKLQTNSTKDITNEL